MPSTFTASPACNRGANTGLRGVAVFTPFINLPSRKLEDYYKLIKHPVSLKSVQKRTHGQHGRNPPTEITDFKTWDAFEQEVSFIWRNAQEYNEDGSDMYKLAGDLEVNWLRQGWISKQHTDTHVGALQENFSASQREG